MQNRIPLPGADNPQFKDVMDYWQQIQKMKQQQPLVEAQTQHATAQANRENALSNLPFAGHAMPGAAGRALALETVRQKYGEDSPIYQNAKQMIDMENKRNQSTVDYQKFMMDSGGKRYASPTGKMIQEQNDIDNGVMPGTTIGGQQGNPLTPEQQDKFKNIYDLKTLKNTTDASVRQKILYAKNMETTLGSINPDDLTSYSGLKGTGELAQDAASAANGNISPRYKKYQQALTASTALAKQIRQFYGDSITPSVQEGLQKLTNPTTWLKNPEIAKAQFIYFRDKILKPEARNLYSAAKSAKIYEAPEDGSATSSKYTDDQLNKWADEARKHGVSEEKIIKKMAQLKGGA